MSEYSNKSWVLDKDTRYDFKISFNLSIGVFLFILFLQPFEFHIESFNNRLLFVSGFAGITLIFMTLFQIVIPRIFHKLWQTSIWEVGPPIIISFLVWAFNSVAFSFYLRFVGSVPVSMFIVFKIVLICLAPVIIVRAMYKDRFQSHQIQMLIDQNKKLQLYLKENKNTSDPELITIRSENNAEKIDVKLSELLFIKSADNYIEVYFKENNEVVKKMIRNTLKTIELNLEKYPTIIRTHRTCIINSVHIRNLNKSLGVYNLSFHDTDETIPVSRQYLLKVKEALE